ncbi:hypothetical protein ACH4TX_35590 [Streptomyces sp. NPDC021098]|uniref:hypothetical protein n=1 Tax=unclassified Streptomyces TaxID=2593676 RepID=UPI0037A22088
MNATFEERLLDELKREVALRAAEAGPAPSVARRLVTPRRVGFALAACGAAAAVAVALPGSSATPAYAVEKNPDGTVTLTLDDINISGPEQRNLVRDLRESGVHTQLNQIPKGMRCKANRGEELNGHIITVNADPPTSGEPQKPLPWRQALHRGDTVAIDNTGTEASVFSFFRGKASPCALEPVD